MTALAEPMTIRSAVGPGTWQIQTFVESLAQAPTLRPFDPRALALCGALSRELLAMRDEPAAVALGYWLRGAALERLQRAFLGSVAPHALRVPRGTVLHVTPANVDTVFIHSWVLALLAGDRSVVRLSSRSSLLRERLLAAIGRTLEAADAAVREANRFVLTGHDDAIMSAISAVADVRVIWGGDATVEHIRRFPLRPRGRDVTFPDRHSFAILDAATVAAAPPGELSALASAFFNDAYWFDQGACSSPRLLVWTVEDAPAAAVGVARTRFHAAVSEVIRARGYEARVGIAITKLTTSLLRAAGTSVHIERASNELTWVLMDDLAAYDRDSCGGGLFFEVVSGDLLGDLRRLVGPRDQTAACFGIEGVRARRLAIELNGQGIDRWVPIGGALEFDATWDGYDLLAELTRLVTIDLPALRRPDAGAEPQQQEHAR